MNIFQKGEFKRAYKRLHENQLEAVNSAIECICSSPMIGESKKGDLAGVRVYKFNAVNQLFLLAYDYNEAEDSITLRALGPHENFYRDLKN